LHTGRLIALVEGTWPQHDLTLTRQLLGWLHTGEVLVADRAFGGWFFLRQLLERKVDLVIRRHQARTLRSRCYRSWQEAWENPHRPCGQPKRSWKKRQEILTVRLVCFRVQVRGHRAQGVIVVTSLLDVKALPASAIAERSVRRWQVERHFRQIKTNLALDGLRGLSPSMIEREIWMHAIADNLVGAWLLAVSLARAVRIGRLSFKGALDALQARADCARHSRRHRRLAHGTPGGPGARPALPLRSRRHRWLARRTLLARLANDLVPDRPGRSEPRARKRRPKNYLFLTRPRRRMRVSTSRRLR
jgi:hypothetical protein